jgi:hypothetical protein
VPRGTIDQRRNEARSIRGTGGHRRQNTGEDKLGLSLRVVVVGSRCRPDIQLPIADPRVGLNGEDSAPQVTPTFKT